MFIIEPDISLVELIPNSPPPILILRLLDELSDLIILLLLGDLLQMLIIAEMLELIIPTIGDTTYLHTGQLILLVVGFVIALLACWWLLLQAGAF